MEPDPLVQMCQHRSCRVWARAAWPRRRGRRRCRKRRVLPGSVVTLDQIARGQSARVLRVGGRSLARRRLLELGLVRGESITLVRVAPLGDPLEYAVKGYHLSLRRQDAASITVEALAATPSRPTAGDGESAA